MSTRIVCDASAVVATLTDSGQDGRWAAERFSGAQLFAPSLMPFECANVLRRLERDGSISPDQAVQAHADLLDLTVDLWPYELLASRVWQLRHNVSSNDAAYLALAETISANLVTLDRRLSRIPGTHCAVDCP